MPPARLDLHSHSHYSDGTSSPAEVVRRAHAAGVEVLALTDHDSISGFPEALEESKKLGIRVVCGIEINTCEEDNLHFLGYGIDPESKALQERLQEFRNRRQLRLQKIVDRLREAQLDITWEEVQAVSKQTLGRPHVADVMIAKKIVRSRRAAFDKYLMKGRPGYVGPMGPTAQESIEAIKAAGGWASVAHPGSLEDEGKLKRWVSYGLSGIEAYYPTHTAPTTVRLLELCAANGLTPTGGSDFHGPKTGRDRIGVIEMKQEHIDRVMEKL